MRRSSERDPRGGGGGGGTPKTAAEAVQVAAEAGLKFAGELLDPANLKAARLRELVPDFKWRDLLRRRTWSVWMESRDFPLPLLRDLRSYSGATARADLIAALTVMLVSIPQAMGFALLVGLPGMMVLKTIIVGGLAAAFFLSSRHVAFGATNSVSLVLAASIHGQLGLSTLSPAQTAIALALMIGLIQLGCGLLRLGQITQFISRSVVIGYGTGIGVLLALGQFGNLLGLQRTVGQGVWAGLADVAAHVSAAEVRWEPFAMGGAALAAMMLLRKLRPRWPDSLLVLLACAAATYSWNLDNHGIRVLRHEGDIGWAGAPAGTDLFDELRHFGSLASVAFALAVLGMLEAVSISKTLSGRRSGTLNPNQELVGMGVGNLFCSIAGAMPGSASFARSAANQASGARTQMSSVLSSLLVLCGIVGFTPLLEYMPVPALAAHLILVGLRIINWEQVFIAVRSTRSDASVFSITFASTLLLPLDTAIYVGIGASLALYLSKAAMPVLAEYAFNDSGNLQQVDDRTRRANEQISIIHVEGELFFGAADLFQDEIRRLAENQDIRVFILRMKNARHLDATSVFALKALVEYLHETKRHLLISGAGEDVMRVLRNSRLLDHLGADNVFPAESNPTMATKRALLRACTLLGIKSSSFRIFYDRSKETRTGHVDAAQADALPDHWEI